MATRSEKISQAWELIEEKVGLGLWQNKITKRCVVTSVNRRRNQIFLVRGDGTEWFAPITSFGVHSIHWNDYSEDEARASFNCKVAAIIDRT